MKVYGKALAVFLSLLIILSVIVVSPREVLAKGNDFLEMPDTPATADEAPEEIPDTPSTPDESTSDESKIRFEYMIKSGEVTITGMEGTADELVVPAFIDGRPVVKIAETAFYSQIYLTKATLPHTLKEIEEYAFAYCENLQKVNMAEGVEIIGESAFDGCVSLSEIRLPSTVAEIYGSAFLDYQPAPALPGIFRHPTVKQLWSAADRLDKVTFPVLWKCWCYDNCFSIGANSLSYQATKDKNAFLSMSFDMGHSHTCGWNNSPETYRFAKSVVNSTLPLICIDKEPSGFDRIQIPVFLSLPFQLIL